jgi:hypothetical protein
MRLFSGNIFSPLILDPKLTGINVSSCPVTAVHFFFQISRGLNVKSGV